MMRDGSGSDGRDASCAGPALKKTSRFHGIVSPKKGRITFTRRIFVLIYQCGNVSSATDCSDGLRLVTNGSVCTLRMMLAAESLLICAPLQFPGLE